MGSMKRALFATLLLITPTSAMAYPYTYPYGGAGTSESNCYRYDYREEYVPGTSSRPGYVRTYRDKVRIPCTSWNRPAPAPSNPSGEGKVGYGKCTEGAVIGGLLGGGLAAAVSKKDALIWSIPAGIIGGGLVGCGVDTQ